MSTDAKKGSSSAPAKPRRIQDQGVRLIPLLLKSVKSAGLLLAVWLVGYRHYSISWVLVSSFVYAAVVEYRKKRLAAAGRSASVDDTLARVDELPSWVYFPDVERAEWLNKMIQQMWPYIGLYIKKLLKEKVEPIVNSVLPAKLTPFTFDTIDLGTVPPRVGGVKVYIDNIKRDEIIVDMEVVYASDADLKVSHRGFHAGVKDIQVSGTVRIVIRPLVNKIPIIGGLTICFIHQPKIDFDLTDVANLFDLPLLSSALRTVVGDQLANILVLPNKITVQLIDEVYLNQVRFPMPKGIVQLSVKEAADLKKADFGLFGHGKSDPYCKISVGEQTVQTRVIENTISPVWNETFEFLIWQEEKIDIQVFDKDPGDDDKLGRISLDLSSLIASSTLNTWFTLEEVKTGRIHLVANWLYLSADPATLAQAKLRSDLSEHLSTAILFVFVDSAKNLPVTHKSKTEPSPFVVLQVGNTKLSTSSKESTTSPKWEEKFEFLCNDPKMQDLNIEVVDSENKSGKSLGTRKVPLKDLLVEDMTISRPYNLRDSGPDAAITLRLCLRILTLEAPHEETDQQPQESAPSSTRTSKNFGSDSSYATPPAGLTAAETLPAAASSSMLTMPSSLPAASPVNSGDDVHEQILFAKSAPLCESLTDTGSGSGLLLGTGLSPDTQLRQRKPVTRFGCIQLTIRYSVHRSQLIIVIHQCKNLIACDSDNLADPYVRLYLLPDHSSSSKRKTQTLKNTLNPTFDETFSWPVSRSDIVKHSVEIMVKNSVSVFSKDRVNMGKLSIKLSTFGDVTVAKTGWYDLEDPDIE